MRVTNIESGNYVGYIWFSNDSKPRPINGNFTEDLSVKNPFIIEGQLYDEERKVSYSIKFVDGEYFIYRYDIHPEDLSNEDVIEKSYYAHRLDKVEELYFLEYWRVPHIDGVEQGDELCENMKVLQPAEKVFVGFKSIKSKED